MGSENGNKIINTIDYNLDHIIKHNYVFQIYLTLVEIFVFCIIAKMVSELDKFVINRITLSLDSSRFSIYFEALAEILAEIVMLFGTVLQVIGIYTIRISLH